MPAISIIIPVFNGDEFLEETVSGVLEQTFQDWELIIVNDGSTDASPDIAAKLQSKAPERIKTLHYPENRGASHARNYGFQTAKGKYVIFLDADDFLLNNMLEIHWRLLENSSDSVIMSLGPGKKWFSWLPGTQEKDNVQKFDFTGSSGTVSSIEVLKSFLGNTDNAPTPSGTLIRSSAVKQVSGWDNSFRSMYDDHVFYSKLMLLNKEIHYTPEVLFLYRKHDASLTARNNRPSVMLRNRKIFLAWLRNYYDITGFEAAALKIIINKEILMNRLKIMKIMLFGEYFSIRNSKLGHIINPVLDKYNNR